MGHQDWWFCSGSISTVEIEAETNVRHSMYSVFIPWMNKWMALPMVEVLLNVSSKTKGQGNEGNTGQYSWIDAF